MSKTPEIANKGLSYTVPDAFNKPRSHFYATNSMLNYEYGGPLMNSVKHIFGEGGFKSMAKNIPSPYQFAGTKIYRDTTEIPSFKQGGNLEQPWLNNLYPNGGQLYTYADRPEAVYQKDDKGNWLIKLPSTNGQFVPLNDPTGKRAGELNEKAVLMPSQFRKQYDAFEDTKPQVAENTALPNIPQSDPTLINQAIAQKKAEQAVVTEKIKADPLLTHEQKLAIITNPQKLNEYEYLAYAPGPDKVIAHTPTQQSVGDRITDIAFNPMTSLGYWMRGQEIPDNLQRRLDYGFEERNPLDMVTDVTPIGALHSANNIYTKATDDIDGNFWTTNTALDVANILPTAKLIRSGMKGFTPRNSFNVPAIIPRIGINPDVAIDFGRQTYPLKGAVGLTDEAARVPEETPVKPKQTKEELDEYINNLADKYKKEGQSLFVNPPEKTFGNMVSNQMDWNNYVKNFNNNPLGLSPINLRNVGNGLYLDGYVNGDLGKGGRGLKPADTGLFGTPAETLNDFAPANPEHIFTTPIAQNSLEAAIASPASLGLETIGSLLFRNREKTLREAEDWMNNWVQHPATQAKIAASHELGKTLPREEYKSIFSGPDVPQQFTVARSPLESHNLNQAILTSANYDATGRLQEYPLKQQVSDLLQFKPGIHMDNRGISYTHNVNPGQWINSGNTLDPSINVNNSYNMENADGTPSAEAFPRYGNWISRMMGAPQRLSTGIHELTHDFGRAATLKSTGQDKVLTDAVDQDVVAAMKEKHRTNGRKLADIIYYTDPTEIHARVMQARHHFDLTPDQTVTPEMAGNMMKDIKKGKTKIDSDWANYFTDNEKTATMFNKAWMAPAAIAGGTAATLLNNPWASKEQPMGLRQGGPFQTSYYSSDVNDNYYAEGGFFSKRKDKNTTGLLATDIMQGTPGNPLITPILPNNEAFPLPIGSSINTEPTIKLDPNAVINSSVAPENPIDCKDGRCYETDQAQELLDKTHKTIGTALNMDRYIAEQVWNGAPANKEWQKLGVRTADQITGDPNAFACANSATRSYEACNPQEVNDADTLSNARMKAAVAAGRTPFRKVASYPNNDFLNGNNLKPGQLISFMGNGTNHMIKYYGDNFNEDQRAFMQSNGDPSDWSFMTNYNWLPNVPASVYEYAPHYDEIQALEEKARTNPTYVQEAANVGTNVGTLPLRPLVPLAIEGNRTFKSGGSLPKPYSLPEDSFRQGARNLHNSIYASTSGQYPQPYENGGILVTNSAMPQPKQVRPNIIPASAFNAPVEFHPETYADIEKSDGTTYKKGLDGMWYISGPRAKDYKLMHDPAGIWADSLETGIREAKVIPISEMPIEHI